MSVPARVIVGGPLGVHATGFWAELIEQGYTPWSATSQLRLMAHLSRWMDREHLEPLGLSDQDVERFLLERRAAGHTGLLSSRALVPLLGYLRARGAVADTAPATGGPLDLLLAEFADYLVVERGVQPGTSAYYQRIARSFLSELASPDGLGKVGVTASDVTGFMLARARRGGGSLAHEAAGLRCLLRFLHVQGYVPCSLVGAVPASARWHRGAAPGAVEPARVALLLGSCDQHTLVGRRDRAILVVLARLGLRAGEVAALVLEDIDWRAGVILVHGKGNRLDRLPLPTDVGAALAEHLRGRAPHQGDRHVFLRVRAPRTALSGRGVCSVVRQACVRAGLPEIGAHRLRHTAATETRRAGAPLGEVAQLLRHRRWATTALYATLDRADRDALRALGRPWPTGGVR